MKDGVVFLNFARDKLVNDAGHAGSPGISDKVKKICD